MRSPSSSTGSTRPSPTTPSAPRWPKASAAPAAAIAAVRWLQRTYPLDSYCIISHPSRSEAYTIADLRTLNDAAPTVCFGFEGLPGRQKAAVRGSYTLGPGGPAGTSSAARNAPDRVYGGADIMIAEVGGVWDSLLAEGRRYFTFANSDFHDPATEFWPGEYSKNLIRVAGTSYRDLVGGLRSGDSVAVLGDLVDGVEMCVVTDGRAWERWASRSRCPAGGAVDVVVRIRSPRRNRHGDSPVVDHVDLVMGSVTGRIAAGSPRYGRVGSDARVVARFATRDAPADPDGWITVVHSDPASGPSPCSSGCEGRTSRSGLPVSSTPREIPSRTAGHNDAAEAWRDLWFYGNPMWVRPDPLRPPGWRPATAPAGLAAAPAQRASVAPPPGRYFRIVTTATRDISGTSRPSWSDQREDRR